MLATVFGSLVAGLAVIWGGWRKWIKPWVGSVARTWVALRDSLIGREAQHDSITGREIQPALPGIGVRMEAVETNVGRLIELVAGQHRQDERLDEHEAALTEHGNRLKQLEDGTIERIATKAESVAAWKAVAAVAKQEDPMVEDATVIDDEPELG